MDGARARPGKAEVGLPVMRAAALRMTAMLRAELVLPPHPSLSLRSSLFPPPGSHLFRLQHTAAR